MPAMIVRGVNPNLYPLMTVHVVQSPKKVRLNQLLNLNTKISLLAGAKKQQLSTARTAGPRACHGASQTSPRRFLCLATGGRQTVCGGMQRCYLRH